MLLKQFFFVGPGVGGCGWSLGGYILRTCFLMWGIKGDRG